jgi:hypothetical protein
MTPFPLTYAVAAILGIAVGIGLELVARVPWWLPAVGFPAAAWLLFMSTAFWGSGRLRRADFLRALDPIRAHEEELADLVGAIRRGDLSAHAVAGWKGPGSLGGWGRSDLGWNRVALRFVDPDDGRRWVDVETMAGSDARPAELRKEELLASLSSQISDPPAFRDVAERVAWHEARRRQYGRVIADLAWAPHWLVVDGAPTAAEVARLDDGVAVLARHRELAIEVLARNVPVADIELTSVSDLEPYVEGMRRLRGG